mmetsp:Transcript_10445/g.14784  ORF Transcript_10445/g.14784 Transcript_10445/m.14784 type:complete len:274 (+) Transcript_10445:127-948(+)
MTFYSRFFKAFLSLWLLTIDSSIDAFSVQPSQQNRRLLSTPFALSATTQHNNNNNVETTTETTNKNTNVFKTAMASMVLSTVLATSSLTPTQPSFAYEDTDYASDTVQQVLRSLKESSGDSDKTFAVYEEIAAIITEGKGVGGEIDYKGVALNRGYIADEDTAIYNPGLTLLTESEKERLVSAVIDARKAGLSTKNGWTENNQIAYDFLKEKLDPLHMTELRGYLSILPIYGAVWYLVALGVQQLARDAFPFAYLVGVAGVFGPALALIVLGP